MTKPKAEAKPDVQNTPAAVKPVAEPAQNIPAGEPDVDVVGPDHSEVQAALALVEDPTGPEESGGEDAPPAPSAASLKQKPVEAKLKEGEKEEESGEPAEEPPALAKSWETITRKERRLQEKAREIEEREKRLAEIEKRAQDAAQAQNDLAESLRRDTFGTLVRQGVDVPKFLDDIASGRVGQNAPAAAPAAQPTDPIMKELHELRETVKSMVTGREKESKQQARVQLETQIGQTLADQKYELLATYPNAAGEIWDYLATHAQQTGEVLPVSVAADNLQEAWREHLATVGSRAAVRAALGLSEGAPASDDEGQSEPEPKPKAKGKTLTNASAARPTRPPPQDRVLSDREELELAEKLIR